MAESPRPLLLVLGFVGVATIWGFNYLFVRAGLGLANPLWLAAFRAGLGALAAAVFVLPRRGVPALDRRGRIDAALLGLPNTALFFGLWFLAAGSVLPGETAVIVYTFPLWVAVLAGPVLGDHLRPVHWAILGVGFVGVAMISQPWAGSGASLRPVPVVELLVGAISWALGTVLMQRRFRASELQQANAYQLLGGAAALVLVAAGLAPGALPSPSWALGADVLWLGLVGTALAYSIWFHLLGRIPAATLSGFTFLVPLVALAASAVVYGERLDLTQAAGVVLVLVAIAATGRWMRSRGPALGAGTGFLSEPPGPR